MAKKCGIYQIQNTINSKLYIGKAVNISNRFRQHRFLLNHRIHFNPHLQSSWTCYGSGSFQFAIIEECDKQSLLDRETYWVKHYDTLNPLRGYNNSLPISGNLGRHWSQEMKDRISAALKGKPATASGLARKGKTPHNAKWWKFVSPSGEVFIERGMGRICREYGLSSGTLHMLAVGKRNNYRGWKVEEYVGLTKTSEKNKEPH